MYKEVRDITAQRGGELIKAQLTAQAPINSDWETCFHVEVELEGRSYQGTGSDFLVALDRVRRQLEKTSTLLRIYGASRTGFASGFARSNADGLRLYIIERGARPERVVDSFGTGPDGDPCTVDEQTAFRNLFLASLSEGSQEIPA
jgi:hypothetical protein